MGALKNLLPEEDVLRIEAECLLRKCGAIQRCHVHNYLVAGGDLRARDEACWLAYDLIESGTLTLPSYLAAKEFIAFLKQMYKESPKQCPACAHAKRHVPKGSKSVSA